MFWLVFHKCSNLKCNLKIRPIWPVSINQQAIEISVPVIFRVVPPTLSTYLISPPPSGFKQKISPLQAFTLWWNVLGLSYCPSCSHIPAALEVKQLAEPEVFSHS